MNKNIENIIKDALDNHDSGYIPGAWESMQARLDGTTPTPFYKKWWAAAAFGTVLVGSSTYFMLNESKEVEKTNHTSTTEQPNTAKNSVASNSSAKDMTHFSNTPSTNDNPEVLVTPNGGSIVPQDRIVAPDLNNLNSSGPVVIPSKKTPTLISTPTAQTSQNTDTYKTLSLPLSVCLNEEVMIKNPNDSKTIVVIEPSGRRVEIAPNKSLNFIAKRSGTITVQSGDHLDVITVNQNNDKLYVDVDPSLLFENGIPSLKFNVAGNKNSVSWESNIKGAETKNNTFIVHPYTERVVTVAVTSTNEFGCKTEERQQVTINEPYNLLAPTGFYPLGNNDQTNRFIPLALKERNVNFEMVIIDPKNGGTVFSTSDASVAWDGIDRRTNEMVNQNTVWPWKVVIRNPNVGEPKEYSGTITRM